MSASVREQASACQATCPSAEFRLNALPQAGGTVIHVLTGRDVALVVAVVLVLAAAVVLTAIWAGSDRRKAAFDVLDRLLPWRR